MPRSRLKDDFTQTPRALLTGASRGIGSLLAKRLAQEGVNLILTARSSAELNQLASELRPMGVDVSVVPADLSRGDEVIRLSQTVLDLGGVDLLIQNAGIETMQDYAELPLDEIQKIVQVNLVAPLVLTRLLLPSLKARARGHIVLISSLAGKAGPACSEPYAATKAGLIGFTQSLRATLSKTRVSASVICPGFVDRIGIYARFETEAKVRAPFLLGAVPPEAVCDAVVKSIRKNSAERIVSKFPVRPLLALAALFPSLGEWMMEKLGAHELIWKVARSRPQSESPQIDPTRI